MIKSPQPLFFSGTVFRGGYKWFCYEFFEFNGIYEKGQTLVDKIEFLFYEWIHFQSNMILI
ncbi:hypothetical protein SAMN04487931_1285 [Desulfobacula phenolica]|uniref:Uncharacterized protein n=1 Tax=Desulfobacula phenolica TaxID=90732 RepID=A0A1H2KAR8_9BACT|nr:hypothetical protein SAMN04487931_1285 [Desulfobacula phenolica]